MSIDALRTPDERFANLPEWPYAPQYFEDLDGYEGLRLHYVDVGARDTGQTFLCLHGEPTWSYLYRKMIPVLSDVGRVVAPDFFGFGRSDKPIEDSVYTWDFHRNALLRFIERLQLEEVTLVCQDWGGLLGLTLPVSLPNLITRLLVMNTALGVALAEPPPGFVAWRAFCESQPDMDVGALMKRAVPGITDPEIAAYDAPFPDVRYKAGVRRFPPLVPVTPDMDGVEISRKAAAWWSEKWSGPTFMAVGVQDPVLGPPVMEMLRQVIKGCPEPLVLEDAGHFVQERGDVVARAALAAWA